MNKIPRFSVRYPTTIMMVVLAILLLGYISFQRLGVDLLPDLNSPRLFVEVQAGELPPEEMEDQFVTGIESVAARGKSVENVSSVARVGKAIITVEYSWDTDMNEAFLDLQKSVAPFAQNSSVDEITVSQHDPNALPVVVAILSHPEIDDLDKLRQVAENNIRNELIRLPGVAAVELIGELRREIQVQTDPITLEAFGLTLNQLANLITNSNINMSGGSIVEMGRRYVIRGIGALESAEDLNRLIVTYKTEMATSGEWLEDVPVYLQDVASVSYTSSEPENMVHLNGERCLALEIFKEARFNTMEASQSIHEDLERLGLALPGYNLQVIQDQAGFIKSSILEVEETALIGIFLAVLILFVFLRRIGVTAVISFAIPISVVATFNLMYFNDLTLNIMTLGGLALGAGMLVDNAIVVVENIFRHLEAGRPLKEAAVIGAGEVAGAITSSTLTTIIVFLPIVYLHGVAGELFREQAWTVAFSLFSSLFVALAVIPMLCSKFLKKMEGKKPEKAVHFPAYGRFLERVLKRRKLVVLLALVVIIAGYLLIPMVGSEFIPSTDRGELYINLTLPEGASLERTAGAVRSLEAIFKENYGEHIQLIYSRIGPAGTSLDEMDVLSGENNAVMFLSLEPESPISTQNMIVLLDNELKGIPDIKAQVIQEETTLQATLGTNKAPLVVELKGKELDELNRLADAVKTKISSISQLANIETSFQEGRPEINIIIDREVAAHFSLQPTSISQQLERQLSGVETGTLEDRGEYIKIILKTPEVYLPELAATMLEASAGRWVRLDEVARLTRTLAPREIIRNNQVRMAEIRAHITGNTPFDQVADLVEEAVSTIEMPAEYSFSVTGQEKLRRDSFSSLKFALLLAVVLVYMVMAAQFESLLHPFVILLTIPLAFVGTVLILLLLNMPFNIMSFIGMIMLAGIAVNDSIILVDRINQNRRAGVPLDEAIVNAGRTRIRPILMTSITTILALTPLTIGIGEGAALRAPMAIAVIGGLFTSTALTLLVIPSVYRLMAGKVKTVNK